MRKAQDRAVPALRRPWTLRPTHARALAAIPRHWVGLQVRRAELNRLERVKRPDDPVIPLMPVSG
jgi:hypothetical protein